MFHSLIQPRAGKTQTSPWAFSLVLMTAALLTACGAKTGPAKPEVKAASSQATPVASIQELMQALVDPSADALWDSVSSTVTNKGVEDKRPQTPEEWFELKSLAIRLAEAANLLVLEGRPVAHQGHALEDAHVKGILNASDIQKLIDADPGAFAARAKALQAAAVETLKAIEQRDVDKFIETGGKIDEACEGCHRQYWYPNEKRPAP
jgi:hypothetical protein